MIIRVAIALICTLLTITLPAQEDSLDNERLSKMVSPLPFLLKNYQSLIFRVHVDCEQKFGENVQAQS